MRHIVRNKILNSHNTYHNWNEYLSWLHHSMVKKIWDYIEILCTVHILGTTRQTSLTLSNRQVSISSFMFMAYIREFEYNFLMGWRAQDIFLNVDWKRCCWNRKETIIWFFVNHPVLRHRILGKVQNFYYKHATPYFRFSTSTKLCNTANK